jgi:hypothetical protein
LGALLYLLFVMVIILSKKGVMVRKTVGEDARSPG